MLNNSNWNMRYPKMFFFLKGCTRIFAPLDNDSFICKGEMCFY